MNSSHGIYEDPFRHSEARSSWLHQLSRHRFGGGLLAGFFIATLLWLSRASHSEAHTAPPNARQTPRAHAPPVRPTEVVRNSAASQESVVLPDLPNALETAPAVTLEFETRVTLRNRVVRQLRRITRSKDRLHMHVRGEPHEWLFLRNATDPRRVSGILVDHRKQALVEHDESELRNLGIARGWADVALLGVTPEQLREATLHGSAEKRFGLRFLRFDAPTADNDPPAAFWWSPEHSLPLRFSAPNGSRSSVTHLLRLDLNFDASVLRDPRARFPSYESIDIADFREKHHEHASTDARHRHTDHP